MHFKHIFILAGAPVVAFGVTVRAGEEENEAMVLVESEPNMDAQIQFGFSKNKCRFPREDVDVDFGPSSKPGWS